MNKGMYGWGDIGRYWGIVEIRVKIGHRLTFTRISAVPLIAITKWASIKNKKTGNCL